MLELDCFGPGARFHHVGLGVREIRAVCPDAEIVAEPTQRVSLAFVDMHGIRVELLEPLGESSPIARSMRAGIKLLHLCFAVPDLDAALAQSRAKGFHRLGPPVAAGALEGRRVAWVFHAELGLFELFEAEARARSAPATR